MKRFLMLALVILLAGCDLQMKSRALPPEETNHGLEMTTDDQGRTRMQEVHEYRLGGVELKSR
jgi:outer membrane lipopolysaccharide assembly protein LptE/RlpB